MGPGWHRTPTVEPSVQSSALHKLGIGMPTAAPGLRMQKKSRSSTHLQWSSEFKTRLGYRSFVLRKERKKLLTVLMPALRRQRSEDFCDLGLV